MSNLNTLKPFQSGFDSRRNIKGRPVGSKNIKTLIMHSLQRKVGEGKDRKTLEKLLVERVINMAVRGDFKMIKLIWEYTDGKPPKWKGDGENNTQSERGKVLITDEDDKRIEELFTPNYPWDKPAYE